MATILFVMTGADRWTLADGTEHPTGYWAEEAAVPHAAFTGAGHKVVVATPGGVEPVADAASLTPEIAPALEAMTGLRAPLKLEEVDPADYDAVFYPGGHGPMEDLAGNADSARVLAATLASGRPLALVCHAPAALLATADADGSSPFAGYRLTAFTNAEEARAGFADRAEWLLQDRLVELGADFVAADPFTPHIEVDRNLYTGQNPPSSAPLAQELLKAL